LKFTVSLKKNEQFRQVLKDGKFASSKLLTMFITQNNLPQNRLGISVSKKISNKAVVRNKIKRRIKEAYRLIEPSMPQYGYDIVVIPKADANKASFSEIAFAVKHLLKRQGFCK